MNNRTTRAWWVIVGVLAVLAFPARAAEDGRMHAQTINGWPGAGSLIALVAIAPLLFWVRRRSSFGRACLVPIRAARPGRPCRRSRPSRD